MSNLTVLQSHADNPHPAVRRATASVRAWAETAGAEYFFLNDALFDFVSGDVMDAAGSRRQMAADIARLHWIAARLDAGDETVIWLDADVLIFAPAVMNFAAPDGYAFGREVWVQPDDSKLRAHRNVHNAILIFTSEGRTTLDFYRDTAIRLLLTAGPHVPPQFVGPKLLSALHNVVQFPLTDCVGMASPPVIRDLAAGGGPAWDLVKQEQGAGFAALNLCSSLFGQTVDGIDLSDDLIGRAIDTLPGMA